MPTAFAYRSVGDCEKLIDGILQWKQDAFSAPSPGALLNTYLAKEAGTGNSDWYAIAVCRYDASVSLDGYTDALKSFVKGAAALSATERQRIALVLSLKGENKAYIEETLKETVGKLGVMSYVFGLLLLDSGDYASLDAKDIVAQILSLEIEGGGWALKGTAPDIDVTAMTLSALAPYQKQAKVKAAVGRALELLSKAQRDGGDFASWGTKNAESTAQVLTALCSLGIYPEKDGRFIKNGNSVIDGLLLYKKDNGGFSHTGDTNASDTASVQAFYALTAYWRLLNGKAALFDFAGIDKAQVTPAPSTTKKTPPKTTVMNNTLPPANTAAPIESVIHTAGQTAAASGTAVSTDAASNIVSDTVVGGTAISTAASPSESVTQSVSGTEKDRSGQPLYKTVLLCAIILAASGTLLWLGFKRKLNKKNALCVIAVAAALLLAAAFVNIKTPAEYYADGGDVSGAFVTVEIRCDNAVGVIDSAVPTDGTILKKTAVAKNDGDTVYTALERAAKANKIRLDCEGGKTAGYYVKGIGQLYEFDGGETSGWVYTVNGVMANTAVSSYTLSEGDAIVFIYTLDLGKDVPSSSAAG